MESLNRVQYALRTGKILSNNSEQKNQKCKGDFNSEGEIAIFVFMDPS